MHIYSELKGTHPSIPPKDAMCSPIQCITHNKSLNDQKRKQVNNNRNKNRTCVPDSPKLVAKQKEKRKHSGGRSLIGSRNGAKTARRNRSQVKYKGSQ